MSNFTLTPAGLGTDTEDEINAAFTIALRGVFGNKVNTVIESIFGQWVNIVTEAQAQNQQKLLQVLQSMDPNNATGVSLDQRAALTGSLREGATESFVQGLLIFDSAGTANIGDLILNVDLNTQWELTSGPHTAVGPFPESIEATFQAVDTGPLQANAGTVWSAVTAIPGIADPPYTNADDDANLGSDQQTDPEFRVTRQTEIFSQNMGPLAAITGAVSKLDGVIDVRVFANAIGPGIDANGIPFKAFNVIVDTVPTPPGADLKQEIFDRIWSAQGVGGRSFGAITGTTVDVESQPQPMAFDIVVLEDVFITVTLDTTGTEEPVTPNLAAVVQAQVLAVCQADFTGIDADTLNFKVAGIVSDMVSAGTASGIVTIVVGMSNVSLALSVSAPIDPVPISIRQRADFDSVNVAVVVV